MSSTKPLGGRKTAVFQYVPHHEVEQRLRQGWTIEDSMLDSHHGMHAIIMRLPDKDGPHMHEVHEHYLTGMTDIDDRADTEREDQLLRALFTCFLTAFSLSLVLNVVLLMGATVK